MWAHSRIPMDVIRSGWAMSFRHARDVFRHDELARRMPSGAIEQQDGVRALSYIA